MKRRNLRGRLNWDPSIDRAKELQREAVQKREEGDYLTAKDLFIAAEEEASKATHRLKYDLGFFCLQDALRCYEEHLLPVLPELLDEHDRHARRFFESYSNPGLMLKVNRVKAITFLQWRNYYRYFLRAHLSFEGAIARGEISHAENTLNDALEKSATFLNSDEIPKWWALIWRSKLFTFKKNLEMAKPLAQRDFGAIAKAFEAAADLSAPPDDPEFTEPIRQQIQFYRHMHRSEAERWRANKSLAGPSGADLEKLRSALYHYSKAAEQAQSAVDLAYTRRDAESHFEYVTYWKCVVQERVDLLDYVRTLEAARLSSAREAVRKALESAKSIVSRVGEDTVFPNRFYSITHLESETSWIDALEHFSKSDFPRAASLLESYCENFSDDEKGSWWHSNARVRFLAAQILVDYGKPDVPKAKTSFAELAQLLNEEPCGGAAAALKDELANLLRGRITLQDAIPHVLQNLPLDASADELAEPTEEETLRRYLRSLPKEISTVMDSEMYSDESSFHSTWVSMLAILLDFYRFSTTGEMSANEVVQEKSRAQLTQEVLRLNVFNKLAEPNRRAIVAFAEDPRNRWIQRGCAMPLLRKIPLIVHIQAPNSDSTGFRWYARPIWSRGSPRKRGFKIAIRSQTPRAFSESDYWYLSPEYRRGHRPSLLLKTDEFLMPCRVYKHRPLTKEELDIMRFEAGARFEDLVRRFLQAHLPPGFEVKHQKRPETDFVIDLDEILWVGETKFTVADELSQGDANRAAEQLERNADAVPNPVNKPVVRVIVTNSPRISRTSVEWAKQTSHRDVWRVYLRGAAKDFVAIGDGLILSIGRAAELDERQPKIDGAYLRKWTSLD